MFNSKHSVSTENQIDDQKAPVKWKITIQLSHNLEKQR